jgi:hypothetical protein
MGTLEEPWRDLLPEFTQTAMQIIDRRGSRHCLLRSLAILVHLQGLGAFELKAISSRAPLPQAC